MKALLKFQIGPVQDFIAQARSTRDLWSGSYLLSWLVAAGIKALPAEADLIFPSRDKQPMLTKPLDLKAAGILTPNLPNLFIAEVPAEQAHRIAGEICDAIKDEWRSIADKVWKRKERFRLEEELHLRFQAQIDRHLSIAWMATPFGNENEYAPAYQDNGWHLDAVRQTRAFDAWESCSGPSAKDSLSGKEEALVGGTEYRDQMQEMDGEYPSLFSKHADHLGAVGIIKRCWHLAYLAEEKHLPSRSKQHKIRSIPAIAARTDKHDDEEDPQEKTSGEKYIAAIAFDGDQIGKWVNGDFFESPDTLRADHTRFSAALSDFALNRVAAIVEDPVDGRDDQGRRIQAPHGQLIYAGGDDVVALVPADAALGVAGKLREAFREATAQITGRCPESNDVIQPDASAGIAIAHIHSPLQDLIREAQKAEKRAKNEGPRPAFSVTLMKRSGEISHWTAQWESGAIKLSGAILERMKAGELSSKFPHRLTELLTPYRNGKAGLSNYSDAPGFDATETILREFDHAVARQSAPGRKIDNAQALEPLLEAYLSAVLKASSNDTESAPQRLLRSVIDLATTVAFASRNLPKAERQPAS